MLALDVDDVVEAIRLVHELKPWFGVAKVGLELFSSAGPDAVLSILAEGMKVFLDLKLFDIPTTVNKAGRVIGALGASYLTLAGFGRVPDAARPGSRAWPRARPEPAWRRPWRSPSPS